MKTRNSFIRLITHPFNRRQVEIAELKEHAIFREIDSWIKVKSGAMNIASPSKKAMAEQYMRIYFTEALTVYRDICMNYKELAKTPHTIYKVLHKIVSNTNDQAVAACIPSLFIEKMQTRFFKHIDILSNSIVMADISTYSTAFDQISSVLDMSLLFIQMEADTIEETINSMNGELERVLKGTVYDRSI